MSTLETFLRRYKTIDDYCATHISLSNDKFKGKYNI